VGVGITVGMLIGSKIPKNSDGGGENGKK